MRYVIIRDDDTNAFTPIECLERLYRPFLQRQLPVNLAVIPDARADVRLPNGKLEGFLQAKKDDRKGTVPIASNPGLVDYLKSNRGYKIVQHGCYHDYFEFDRSDRSDIAHRIEHGTKCLMDAGFSRPDAFVAPYDKLSRESLGLVSKKFSVLSTGWFELRRLPFSWWPRFLKKKFSHRAHWKKGQTILLSHPGCLLSYTRPVKSMLSNIKRVVENQQVTVLVTHWWEYFLNDKPNEAFIGALHETADYLSNHRDIRVISFSDLVLSKIALN